MIADEVGEFLKFFDNVGYQLACLLDIDGQNNAKRNYNRQKITSKSRTTSRQNTKASIKNGNNNINNINNNNDNSPIKHNNGTSTIGTNKRPSQRTKIQQSSLVKRKRRGKMEKEGVIHELHAEHQPHDQHELINNHQNDVTNLISNSDLDQTLLTQQNNHHHHQACDIQSHNNSKQTLEVTQVLDGPLTLGIVDELQPLDPGASISPSVTHLSPLDPSIQFSTSIHQQHYYPNHRGHLDSYQLHDEFTSSGHETIPITNSTSHITHHHHQQQQHHHHHHHQDLHQQHQQQHSRLDHQHLMSHQQSTTATSTTVSLDGSTVGGTGLTSSDCYPNHQNLNHLHHHHHHQNQSHHQHHQQQHHVQYHQLDQQWLASTTNMADSSLQMGTPDTGGGPLDHVVPLSPASQQSLDQVQFSAPLYQHGGGGGYYNHHQHLDSFQQHINDDYANVSADSLAGNPSSSPLESLHRLQQEPTSQTVPQQQQQPQHLHQMNHSMSINGNTGTGNDSYHHHDQQPHQQHHHHSHHQHHPNNGVSSGQLHHSTQPTQEHHQMQNLETSSYVGHQHHLNNNHHSQHHQQQHLHHPQHQVMPLINGLVEPAGVIIQDINLASASWSSPEDLYSI